MFSETDLVIACNKNKLLPTQKPGLGKPKNLRNSSQFEQVASYYIEFYRNQQRKINYLQIEENRLLDVAARLRLRMTQLNSLPDIANEWHKLRDELDRVETKLVRTREKMEYGDGFD